MKPLLIIKTGAPFSSIEQLYGGFENHVLNQLGMDIKQCLVASVVQRQQLPSAREVSGVIITGSHAMVTDQEPWSEYLADWLRLIPPGSLPVLGICYGHQLLAYAFGGKVEYHPQGMEIGAVAIELTEEGCTDPLLGCLPNSFYGFALHAQTVRRLPADAVLLAKNGFEPHHAFRVRGSMWGVQFHPEFTPKIMRAYVDMQEQDLSQAGRDVAQLRMGVRNHPYGKMLLQRFLALVGAFNKYL